MIGSSININGVNCNRADLAQALQNKGVCKTSIGAKIMVFFCTQNFIMAKLKTEMSDSPNVNQTHLTARTTTNTNITPADISPIKPATPQPISLEDVANKIQDNADKIYKEFNSPNPDLTNLETEMQKMIRNLDDAILLMKDKSNTINALDIGIITSNSTKLNAAFPPSINSNKDLPDTIATLRTKMHEYAKTAETLLEQQLNSKKI
ncbi:MAG: hypothetical protein LBI37_00265 [Puniceicoccales bacterium]|jgi:hypothetical protein|nr:hypothetical protein [Puniceicoccales bacterium]